MQICPGVYLSSNEIDCPLKTINTYLLKDGDDVYLVDTGWTAENSRGVMGVAPHMDGWEKLNSLLDEAGVSWQQISGLILTHSHMDHATYAPRIQQLSGAPILITQKELDENAQMSRTDEGRREVMMHWFGRNGVPETIALRMIERSIIQPAVPRQHLRLLNDGDVIRIGRMSWEVIWVPGHTLGQICLLERDMGLLITGDNILPNETPIIMTSPIMYELHPNPLGSYDWSLHRMQGLPVRLGLPGHGRLMPDFQDIVARQLAHHDTRYDDIMSGLMDGEARDAFALCCTVPWAGRHKLFDQLRATDQLFAFSETMSHLRSLEGQGMVELQDSGSGLIRWRLTDMGRAAHMEFLAAVHK